MDIVLLLIVILAIILIFFVFSMMKHLIKFGLILGIVFLVLLIVTGGSIMNDFSNLSGRITSSPSVVLLESKGDIITGMVDDAEIELFKQDEIDKLDGLYADDKLEEIKGENYKVFVVNIDILDEFDTIEINRKEVLMEDIKEFLLTNKLIRSITYEDVVIDMSVADTGRNSKAALFANVYTREIKMTKNPIFFFRNYKDKIIVVYPETIFFKFTKIIPLAWIEGKLNKLKETVKDKATDAISTAGSVIK